MAAEPVLLAVEEPKFCSLFCKVAASPLEVASVKDKKGTILVQFRPRPYQSILINYIKYKQKIA